ncbi:MAG: ATPase domain-containing protein [Halodesulfurarchaeum sp.]
MTQGRVSTGIAGLDEVLDGGLRSGQTTLFRGAPGAGKTIFGLYFLAEGIDNGETALFVNLGEPAEYLRSTASAFDLHPESIHFEDLAPTRDRFDDAETYSVFDAASVEGPSITESLKEVVAEIEPDRVLLDPVTEFRYLTSDDRQFRTQILSMLDFLTAKGATVVATSQAATSMPDDDLQFLVDAVATLSVHEEGRSLSVSKFRGSGYRRGEHGYEITDAGITVWPKLQVGPPTKDRTGQKHTTGVAHLDQLLHGGIPAGTVTFLSGPTGAGKTTTGLQFLQEAASDGTSAMCYSFEESRRTILERSDAIGLPIEALLEAGSLSLEEIQPDQFTVDEFVARVRADVEAGTEMVMIDGVKGFKANLRWLSADKSKELLRLGRYLRSEGVTTVVTNEVHNITGEFKATEERMSNLADNILFIRHVESAGTLRKVIGVLKMRTSDFDRSLRELEITESGLTVGEPLPELQGILTGTPTFQGQSPIHE